MATMKELEERMQQLAEENELLKRAVLQAPAASLATEEAQQQVINNGYKPLVNPDRPNPDNRDWQPGTPKKWDPEKGYKVGYGTMHTGDGAWEWAYVDEKTGEIYWTGKLLGEHPPGPPDLSPKKFFKL